MTSSELYKRPNTATTFPVQTLLQLVARARPGPELTKSYTNRSGPPPTHPLINNLTQQTANPSVTPHIANTRTEIDGSNRQIKKDRGKTRKDRRENVRRGYIVRALWINITREPVPTLQKAKYCKAVKGWAVTFVSYCLSGS